MAHFLLEYRYVDQTARQRARDEHLAYMRGLHDAGQVVLAGPLADESGAMVVFHVADVAAAQQLVDADPYTAVGATTGHTLREWRIVVPAQG